MIVLISEVPLFQGENNMYLYKVSTQSSVLLNQMSVLARYSYFSGIYREEIHCI